MIKRSSGILLHITSLPSDYGIGDLGPKAYQFVDFLQNSKQKYWQVLPLNVTDSVFGNSPYSSISAFASDPILISPELLVEDRLLKPNEIKAKMDFSENKVDYPSVRKYKNQLFEKAFNRFKKDQVSGKAFTAFCQENEHWLDDFALFVLFKELSPQGSWNTWDNEMKFKEVNFLIKIKKKYADKLYQIKFLQFIFFKQWLKLKFYCQSKDIFMIGDIPIYVNFDSADVWSNPKLYDLDDDFNPNHVAGVPPDYFSETGQRWGNPVYDWSRMKESRYGWWIERMKHNLKLFDFIRIDHFRGLIGFWQIPAAEETAINGQWVNVPWEDFFSTLLSYIPQESIIAEDLGIITDDVKVAISQLGFPGMKILLFAFNGDMQQHPYLPHNFKENTIVYTGTHDNNTACGWFESEATDLEKQNLFHYTGRGFTSGDVHWGLIELAMRSNANLAIFPLQDVLGLGASKRMNTPSTVTDENWTWRFSFDSIAKNIVSKLKKLTLDHRR